MNALREQIRSLLTVQPQGQGYHASLRADSNFSIFPDHFPAFPVLPGICLMQAAVIAAAVRQGADEFHVRSLKNAKMMSPVLPGDLIVIEGEMTPGTDGNFVIKAKFTNGEKRCAEFAFVAGPDTGAR